MPILSETRLVRIYPHAAAEQGREGRKIFGKSPEEPAQSCF